MTPDTKYYYESHITIEPVFDAALENAKRLAQTKAFRVADLLMKKRAEDTPQRSAYDTFMTGHSVNREDIMTRTKELVLLLQEAGVKVWRYKVEETLCDSRNEDVFGLLRVEG